MNQIVTRIVKAAIPARTRDSLRAAHRDFIFRRALNRFTKDPAACAISGHPVLSDLIYGWGNEAWSADDGFLAACIGHALTSRGPILECGSGLSTIVVGAIATQRGIGHWALEHTPEWSARVQQYLNRHQLDAVKLCTTRLQDYGDFSWYAPPLESMPENFSLVLCDGPPGSTKGGRYGLAPVMARRLATDCVILLDDAGREHERAIARRWADELGGTLATIGDDDPYIKLTVTRGSRNQAAEPTIQ